MYSLFSDPRSPRDKSALPTPIPVSAEAQPCKVHGEAARHVAQSRTLLCPSLPSLPAVAFVDRDLLPVVAPALGDDHVLTTTSHFSGVPSGIPDLSSRALCFYFCYVIVRLKFSVLQGSANVSVANPSSDAALRLHGCTDPRRAWGTSAAHRAACTRPIAVCWGYARMGAPSDRC